ncbi:Beta-1,3-galactosyl-O-glycosyl-glycoprotein beta-1,6-N-acetylglucosaminyltransferase [Phlyctochytrium planicorne]|nr:Beta-1,3-galactosyl-O-glycosyl-glycoprotein beta-1,6-N-acetylglucosaminyltransferase [Phlyctochytrium planicorne]
MTCISVIITIQITLIAIWNIADPRTHRPVYPPIHRTLAVVGIPKDDDAAAAAAEAASKDHPNDKHKLIHRPPIRFATPHQYFADGTNTTLLEEGDKKSCVKEDMIKFPRTAYAFMVHSNETISGIKDSISLLWHPSDHFFIHIDAKADVSSYRDLQAYYEFNENIHILPISYNSNWGTVEILAAELALLTEAVKEIYPWDLFILLDGTSFPLKPLNEIKRALEPIARAKQNYIHDSYTGLVKTCTNLIVSFLNIGICNFHRAGCSNLMCSRYDYSPNHHIVWKGSQWVILSRDFANYAILDPVAKDWATFFGGSFGSDEMFFTSLLVNHDEFSKTIVDGSFPYIYKSWSRFGCRSYKPERGYGDSPCYLGIKDFEHIQKSPGFLFARKLYAKEKLKQMIVSQWGKTC